VGLDHKCKIESIAELPSERVVYLPMGVLHPKKITKFDARDSLRLVHNEIILIYVGNLAKEKGVDILIRAIPALKLSGYHFSLFICGQGPEKTNLEQIIEELDLQESIQLVGPVLPENVYIWLTAADLCIVPSRRETFGLVALESMACGTPVIAAEVGGLKENIIHGQNGLLFPKEDYLQLAKRIEQAITDISLREQIAFNGRQTAAKFDMVKQAEKVRQFYFDLASLELSSGKSVDQT
jgi:glycosyltransferase involved in cell wall biosynthesis